MDATMTLLAENSRAKLRVMIDRHGIAPEKLAHVCTVELLARPEEEEFQRRVTANYKARHQEVKTLRARPN